MKLSYILKLLIIVILINVITAPLINAQCFNIVEYARSAQKENKKFLNEQNTLSVSVNKSITPNQNFPNPFNPTTTLSFEINTKEKLKLTVYDFLGREVDVLVNEELQPGLYNFSFNATNLASGTYIYAIQSEGLKVTKKMILLK